MNSCRLSFREGPEGVIETPRTVVPRGVDRACVTLAPLTGVHWRAISCSDGASLDTASELAHALAEHRAVESVWAPEDVVVRGTLAGYATHGTQDERLVVDQ